MPPAVRSRVYLPAVLGGLMLYAGFFPLDLGFLGWVALVPWLTLVRANARPRTLYFAAYLGGLCLYGPAIQWMRVAHPMMYATWIVLTLYSSLYVVLGLAVVRALDRRGVPLVLSAPAAWVAFEYCRAHFPTGFAWVEVFGVRHHIGFGWYFLGYTQHDNTVVTQIADVAGIYGVSFVLVAVNAAVAEMVLSARPVRSRLRSAEPAGKMRAGWVAAAVGLLALDIGYGVLRLRHEPFRAGPRVALLQGSVRQDVKIAGGEQMVRDYLELARRAADLEPAADLVVWPETSVVGRWNDAAADASPSAE